MIIYFDGPDESKKTTLIHAVSEAMGIPVWERGPFLPHHHGRKYNTKDSLWYVLDDMKTLDLFRKVGANILVDRHPVISEIVYREMEGKKSPLTKWRNKINRSDLSDSFVVLLGGKDEDKIVIDYKAATITSNTPFIHYHTEDADEALELIVDFLDKVVSEAKLAGGFGW